MGLSVRHVMAVIASGSLVFAMTTPARADEPPSSVLAVLAAVSESADDPAEAVLDDVADVDTRVERTSAIDERVGATDIVIPTDPRDDISLALKHVGIDISVGLPFSDQAQPATVEAEGIVSYDNGNGSTTVPVVKEDGSVQITTIIDNSDAPARYAYTIALPEGGYLEQLEAGMVVIRDAEGAFHGGVLPAWAKDADGSDVATHYEIDGGVLTQVIEHDATTTFPVVADPAVGGGLLAGYSRPHR